MHSTTSIAEQARQLSLTDEKYFVRRDGGVALRFDEIRVHVSNAKTFVEFVNDGMVVANLATNPTLMGDTLNLTNIEGLLPVRLS